MWVLSPRVVKSYRSWSVGREIEKVAKTTCFSKTYVFLDKSVVAQFFVFFCLSVGREHNFLCELLHEVAIRGQCCPQSEGYEIP